MYKGVIYCPVKVFPLFSILDKLLLAKKRPKLGIQLINAEDDNQSCHISLVLFDIIYQLRVLKYNLYSSTLFYTNVLISTYPWGGAKLHNYSPNITQIMCCQIDTTLVLSGFTCLFTSFN